MPDNYISFEKVHNKWVSTLVLTDSDLIHLFVLLGKRDGFKIEQICD